jgi:hypothetical protein
MPLKLILFEQVSDGVWSAVGTFSNSKGTTGPADLLVQKVDDHSVKLTLDSRLKVSRILNREVEAYQNAHPAGLRKIKKGAEVTFENVWITLKR